MKIYLHNIQLYSIIILIGLSSNIKAQSLNEGIKYINYQKNKSAISVFENLYKINTNDYLIKYWYSQSLIENQKVEKAKELYLNISNNEADLPFLYILKAQIELTKPLANKQNAIQIFDSAILIAKQYDLKLKKKQKHIYSSILIAIGRANAQGGIKYGDPIYAIAKLKEALEIDKLSLEIPIYMGICYQKQENNFGSDAAKSYLESINRNNINPIAYWHIGKIYQTQNNKKSMLEYYSKAIQADPNFPNVYLNLFEFYKEKDINKAKDNLDKYIQLADKDCNTDFYYADYLFRAGLYKESLEKALQMKLSACSNYEDLPILLAYNYDRLNDSVKAKTNIDYYFDHVNIDRIEPEYFKLAENIYRKFPEDNLKLIGYIKNAYNFDTTIEIKKQYAKLISNIYASHNDYVDQYIWLSTYYSLNKNDLHEIDYYNLCKSSLNASNYSDAITYSKKYLNAFPLKTQGYSFYVKAAKMNMSIDSTNGTNIYLDALSLQNNYYLKDSVKNTKHLLSNYYIEMSIYANSLKDYKLALNYCDKYLLVSPLNVEMQNNRKLIIEILDRDQKKEIGKN